MLIFVLYLHQLHHLQVIQFDKDGYQSLDSVLLNYNKSRFDTQMIVPYFILPWSSVSFVDPSTYVVQGGNSLPSPQDLPSDDAQPKPRKNKGIQINLTEAQLLEAGYENNKKAWTDEEDELLISLMKRKNLSWKQIAEQVPGRTSKMCYSRYRRITSPLKSQWTQAQDQQIRSLVEVYGEDWSKISQFLKKRTPKQIKEHYVNYLREEINKSPWTFQEDIQLIELLRKFGKDWSYIESRMKGRTQYQIKNRYFRRLKILEDRKKETKQQAKTH